MPIMRNRYLQTGPILVRASTAPDDLDHEAPAELADPGTPTQATLAWLASQWARPDIREALTMASPDLAARVGQLLNPDASHATAKAVRRAALAAASYLVRWRRRTTPFGLFAAVTTAAIGPAAAKIGDQHRAVARADGEWLTQVIDRLEQHHDMRRRLMVVADSAGFVRDGRFTIAGGPTVGQRTPGPPCETSTRYTRALQLVLAHAARPVLFDDLAAHLAAQAPQIDRARIEAMLHGLVDRGFLLTSLRPPMTTVDGLAHVVDTLTAAKAIELADVAPVIEQLGRINEQMTCHNAAAGPREAAPIRAAIGERMAGLAPDTEHKLAVDLRLDARISIPQAVLHEATRAADVLLRLTTQPFGTMAWLDYHARFRDRYGPGALVPVRDLVADSGLEYPTGFLGAPRARPTWRMLTERDVHLTALIQMALMDGADEIELTDTNIDALTVGDHTTATAPRRIELCIAVYASTTEALDRGDFDLQIAGAPRTPSSMAGRFEYLLDASERDQLARTFAASGHDAGQPLVAQLSFPPRRAHNQNVVRVGKMVPDVVSLSEHPDADVIIVDDLAVTADVEQMYLVHRSTGRRVIPYIPHALDTTVQSPPLARFLAEVAEARSAVFGPLDYGAAARTLPYVPRIRNQRTILAPARWLLAATDLNATDTRTAPAQDRWPAELHAWRLRWRVPARIVVCHGELRLPLDLDQPLDRALLRAQLARTDRLELREDAPADGYGWLGRPAEFLIPMVNANPKPQPLPVTAPPGNSLRPGASTVVHAQLVGNPARADHLLTTHLPMLADSLAELGVRRWWIRRHRDTIRIEADQHLSAFFRLDDPTTYAAVIARLGEFADGLAARRLPAELVISPYHEHPARYGVGDALQAAEDVFAADTVAAIHQLRAAEQAGIPAQALAAASMAQLAAAFAPTPEIGYRTLLDCLQQSTARPDRVVTELARRLADPTGGHHQVRALPGGDAIAAAWQARDIATRTYHDRLLPQRDPASVLRTLLHEHHMRGVGVDPSSNARPTTPLGRRPCAASSWQAPDDHHRASGPQPR